MPEAVRVDIYGPITSCPLDSTEVCARQVLDALQRANGADIELHINSPGGDAFEGMAIANAIRAYKGKTVGIIDGVCASAATMAAVTCGELRMHEASLFMVHEAATFAMGFAEDLEKQAGLLRQINDVLADMYERKTGASREQLAKWMADETWFTPAEALAAKFCDSILKRPANIDSKAFARFVNSYRNAPAQLRVQAVATKPIASAPKPTPKPPRILTMEKKQIIAGLAASLAVAMEYAQAGADSGDAELAEACSVMLADQALPACSAKLMPLAQKEGAEAEPTTLKDQLAIVAAAKQVTGAKEGVVGALEALKRNADRKAGAADAGVDVQVTQRVQDGVKTCKLLPADGERWRAEIKAGRRTVADLRAFIKAALPAGDISGEQVEGAKDGELDAAAAASEDEPSFSESDFMNAANSYKIGGGK